MKKHILTPILFLMSLGVYAQPHHHEKIQTLKISFLTEQLDLTEKEAQEFWPVYNEFDKKSNQLKFQEFRNLRREIKSNMETLTEEKANELLQKMNVLETKIHKQRLEFAQKIQTILPAKKIIKLKVAEEDFKRKMLERYKRFRGERHGGPGSGN
ncbi:Spy/CpxP family protein refolding chaperone [Seonamhaeicola marinus]|uniref:Sensor of ECF-type sigma factor n=1 Tax=Seonamhaeicola marinus TaxID=1912246 RepID=A0A5D0JBL4_9FLAO|nr:sensor of ECF-type sigma factor [Seonamhaeicola marinus]TYA92268.1 sensor of ECF-type sigma factor [Seonamhaeicola marinus]